MWEMLRGWVRVMSYELFLENGLTLLLRRLHMMAMGKCWTRIADTMASSIAVALSKKYAVRLIYCFEKRRAAGCEWWQPAITLITKEIFQQLKEGNKLFDGILPKIDNALQPLTQCGRSFNWPCRWFTAKRNSNYNGKLLMRLYLNLPQGEDFWV